MNDYYRNVYLKSDHWKLLRLEKLLRCKEKCSVCRVQSKNNDVHHIFYKNLENVQMCDLKVLCRQCHEIVHQVLENYPEVRRPKSPRLVWLLLRKKIKVQQGMDGKIFNAVMKNHSKKENLMEKECRDAFKQARVLLRNKGLIKSKSEFVWDDKYIGWFEKQPFGANYEDWFDFYIQIKKEKAILMQPWEKILF